MSPITCPMKTQMSGADVDNLHSAIQLLIDCKVIKIIDDIERRAIYSGLIRERAQKTYGEVTYTLVRRFQEAKGLEMTGHVDERTAEAFNCAIAEHIDVTERFSAS
jgi:peptidoglycan hydrolase-like protein with peptidoglycan-binding domain